MNNQMEKTFSLFVENISVIVSGRVDPGLLESIRLPYHGQSSEIKHVAMLSVQPNRISIRPWDLNLINPIVTALNQKGFDAYKFSKDTVCVNVPPPSGEERLKVVKRIKEMAEDTKVAIRNIRRSQIKALAGTEDECKRLTKVIEDETKKYIREVELRVEQKVGSAKR